MKDIVGVFAGGNTSWAIKDSEAFKLQQIELFEETKKFNASKKVGLSGILNSSQSVIKREEDNSELLF